MSDSNWLYATLLLVSLASIAWGLTPLRQPRRYFVRYGENPSLICFKDSPSLDYCQFVVEIRSQGFQEVKRLEFQKILLRWYVEKIKHLILP